MAVVVLVLVPSVYVKAYRIASRLYRPIKATMP